MLINDSSWRERQPKVNEIVNVWGRLYKILDVNDYSGILYSYDDSLGCGCSWFYEDVDYCSETEQWILNWPKPEFLA
jgi:hypothetical protein